MQLIQDSSKNLLYIDIQPYKNADEKIMRFFLLLIERQSDMAEEDSRVTKQILLIDNFEILRCCTCIYGDFF